MKTTQLGLSPKLTVPLVAALSSVLTSWAATGEFNAGEVRGLIATTVLAVLAYVAPPGDVDTAGLVDATDLTALDEPGSDALLAEQGVPIEDLADGGTS